MMSHTGASDPSGASAFLIWGTGRADGRLRAHMTHTARSLTAWPSAPVAPSGTRRKAPEEAIPHCRLRVLEGEVAAG